MTTTELKHHVGDVGTVFEATLVDQAGAAIDVSGATTKELVFQAPGAVAAAAIPASFTTDGTDGKIRIVTVAGTLHKPGIWSWQAHVVLPSAEWRSEIETFEVLANLT